MKLIFALPLVLAFASVARAGSVFDHVNTPALADAAKAFYAQAVANHGQRKKIIAAAEDECGGRYEGVETQVLELSHDIEVERHPMEGSDADYVLKYTGTSANRWLVTEIIQCSLHGGHSRSVLHARLVTGTESVDVSYHYVNDEQQGDETVSAAKRAFKLGSTQLTGEYKTPYGTAIKP